MYLNNTKIISIDCSLTEFNPPSFISIFNLDNAWPFLILFLIFLIDMLPPLRLLQHFDVLSCEMNVADE